MDASSFFFAMSVAQAILPFALCAALSFGHRGLLQHQRLGRHGRLRTVLLHLLHHLLLLILELQRLL